MRHTKQIAVLLLHGLMLFGLTGFYPQTAAAEAATVVTEIPAVTETPAAAEPAASAAAPVNGFDIPVPDDLPDVDVTSWEFMLANSYNSVGFEYELPSYGGFEGQGLDPRIIDTTLNMLNAARAEGLHAYVSVAYRNSDYLTTYYEQAVANYGGAAEASAHTLPPGCNEHQTGLAIDITNDWNYSAAYYELVDEATKSDPVYDWMLKHCAEYGFILRYPEGKEAWYGTACSRAHFRYVGVEAATYIMEHGLCLEEFLYLEDPTSLFVPGLNTYATF